MGDGNIYEDWSTVAGPYTTMTFSRSIDFGASFQSPIAIPGPTTGGTLAIGPTGELYTASNSRFDKSLNARDRSVTPTFTTTTISLGGPGGSNGTPNPNPGGGLGQTWVDVDRSNGPRRGWIYVLQSVNPSGTDPLDVNFIRSTDGGQTWSTPVRVNNDSQSSTHWQWFGTMSVAPNGRIDAVWNDSRESNQSNMVRLYYAYSNDGGTTWLGNIPVGPVWNSFIGWPQQNKIGDYYDMESDLVGANVAYAATYNGEQDVYFLRIGDYDCNGNGIPDTQDIAADPSLDCNGNGIPDSCEIAAGTVTDVNHDGVPDTCECLVDWNHDGVVNSSDFFAFVNAFFAGDADFNISGTTNSQDFFDFLNGFFAGC
jgi:hypothetical protein